MAWRSVRPVVIALSLLIVGVVNLGCDSGAPGTAEEDLQVAQAAWAASQDLLDPQGVVVVGEGIEACGGDVGPGRVAASLSMHFKLGSSSLEADVSAFASAWEDALEEAAGEPLKVSVESLGSGPQVKGENDRFHFLLRPLGDGGYSFGGGGPCR